MCEGYAGLFLEFFVIIRLGRTLGNGFAANDVILHDLGDHLGFDIFISHARLTGNIDVYQHVTAAITTATDLSQRATAFFHDFGSGLVFFDLFLELLIDLFRAFSDATQAFAHGNLNGLFFRARGFGLFRHSFHGALL